jgi:hypothetical protein
MYISTNHGEILNSVTTYRTNLYNILLHKALQTSLLRTDEFRVPAIHCFAASRGEWFQCADIGFLCVPIITFAYGESTVDADSNDVPLSLSRSGSSSVQPVVHLPAKLSCLIRSFLTEPEANGVDFSETRIWDLCGL